MSRRRILLQVGGVLVAMTALAMLALPRSLSAVSTTVHVIEHATTDTVINTDGQGDTTGDLLTFHNPVFDASNHKRVGHDQGDCIRISPGQGTWECRWTTFLPEGHLTVEGPFYDTKGSVLTVTGGTGKYVNAHGTMELRSRQGGKQFDFIFHLTG